MQKLLSGIVLAIFVVIVIGAVAQQAVSHDAPPPPAPTPILTPVPTEPDAPLPIPIPEATPEPVVTPEPPATPTPEPPAPAPSPTPPSTGGPHLDPGWQYAMETPDGRTVGTVAVDSLNVRSEPSLNAPIIDTVYRRHPVFVEAMVEGDPVENAGIWYQIGPSRFVSAMYVEPFIPSATVAGYSGNWLDINLSTQYAVAYQDGTPVHVAIIISGKPGWESPVGEHIIFHRVASETMDGATVGIPKGSPEYYYLPDVKYTQYFAVGGFAIHTNYWSDPWQFGQPGSHGCINLREADAAFMWDFLSNGSPVSVHY
jgi:hypothetical protein